MSTNHMYSTNSNNNNNASLSKLLNPVKTTKTVNLFGVEIKVSNGDSNTQLLEQLYQQLSFFFNILQTGEKNYRSTTLKNSQSKNDKNPLFNPKWLASVLAYLEHQLQELGIQTSTYQSTFMSMLDEGSQIDPTHIMLDSDSEEFFSATSISTDESSFEESDSYPQERKLAPTSSTPSEPGKRKRGRPRKYLDPNQSPWKKDPNAPKKKRGRPRKHPLPLGSLHSSRPMPASNGLTVSTNPNESTSVFIIEPRKTPGKRGRPRKYPLPTPTGPSMVSTSSAPSM